MPTLVKIIRSKSAPFKGKDGEDIPYFWVKAKRVSDDVVIEFGTPREYEINDEVVVHLEKYERRDGRVGYKEIKGEDA